MFSHLVTKLCLWGAGGCWAKATGLVVVVRRQEKGEKKGVPGASPGMLRHLEIYRGGAREGPKQSGQGTEQNPSSATSCQQQKGPAPRKQPL